MRMMLFICAVAVVGALVAPFFLKIGDKPLMTVDEVVDDATPDLLKTKTQIYRWQDDQGNWHFGERPPKDGAAESVTVEDKITRMGDGWHGQSADPGSSSPSQFAPPGIAAYADGGKKLMEQASKQVEALNERTEQMDAMRQRAR